MPPARRRHPPARRSRSPRSGVARTCPTRRYRASSCEDRHRGCHPASPSATRRRPAWAPRRWPQPRSATCADTAGRTCISIARTRWPNARRGSRSTASRRRAGTRSPACTAAARPWARPAGFASMPTSRITATARCACSAARRARKPTAPPSRWRCGTGTPKPSRRPPPRPGWSSRPSGASTSGIAIPSRPPSRRSRCASSASTTAPMRRRSPGPRLRRRQRRSQACACWT